MANNWFLNDPFREGQVYQQLLNMNYRFVVGMDIGHGESLFYLLRKSIVVEDGETGQKIEWKKLGINQQNFYRISTMIGFDGDKIVLGSGARTCPVYYQHFKAEPGKWDKPNRVEKPASNKYLMETFIQDAWKGILENEKNRELQDAVRDNQVLIAVGCPASQNWTNAAAMESYQQLIKDATGYDHVVVQAESTAAIMSALLLPGNRPMLSRGMAVVDAGSSSIDFTYVLLGKQLITASLDVAGYRLDELMLEQILENNHMSASQIPAEQLPDILIQIRLLKERFYAKDKSLQEEQTLYLWGQDEEGHARKDIHGGKLVFRLNQAFMQQVQENRRYARNKFAQPKSWLEHCDGFIRDCRALIPVDSEGKMLCDRVIVTGGTSYVTAFYDRVKANYPKGVVIGSDDRAASVAKGLCYAKTLELRGREQVLGDGKPDTQTKIPGYKREVEKLAQENYEAFMLSLALYLADAVIGDIQEVVSEHAKKNEKITAGWLLFWIKNRVEKDPKVVGDPCKAKVKQLFEKHLQESMQTVKEKVNAVSQTIYGTQLGAAPQIPELTPADFAGMVTDLDIAGVMNDTWLSSIVSCVNFAAITNTLFLVGCGLLATPLMPLGVVLLGMCALSLFDEVQKKVMDFIVSNDTVLSHKVLKKMQENFSAEEERSKMLNRSVYKTQKILLKGGILKKEFMSGIQTQAEAMLGKVLFLVYDEQPEVK